MANLNPFKRNSPSKKCDDDSWCNYMQPSNTTAFSSVLHYFVISFFVFLGCVSIPGVVVLAVWRDAISNGLGNACARCEVFHFYLTLLAAALALLSLLALYAIATRNAVARFTYTVVLTLIFIIATCTGVCCLLAVNDLFDLENIWDFVVEREASHGITYGSQRSRSARFERVMRAFQTGEQANYVSVFCPLQRALRCSGWQNECNSQTPYNIQSSVMHHCPVCSNEDQLALHSAPYRCGDVIIFTFKQVQHFLLPAEFGIAAIALLSIVHIVQIQWRSAKAVNYPTQFSMV